MSGERDIKDDPDAETHDLVSHKLPERNYQGITRCGNDSRKVKTAI